MDTLTVPAINVANARELQQRSVEARKRNKELRAQAEELARQQAEVAPEPPANACNDPYIDDLVHAQIEYLAKLRACESAKDAAALSQTLKNLRETYHMASGQPKPGTIKPERQSSRQQVKPASEPKLDTPTGSGPAS